MRGKNLLLLLSLFLTCLPGCSKNEETVEYIHEENDTLRTEYVGILFKVPDIPRENTEKTLERDQEMLRVSNEISKNNKSAVNEILLSMSQDSAGVTNEAGNDYIQEANRQLRKSIENLEKIRTNVLLNKGFDIKYNEMIELKKSCRGGTSFGVIALAYGKIENIEKFKEFFNQDELEIDGIIMLGGYSSKDDTIEYYNDIVESIEIFAETGLTVYAIRGGRDNEKCYEKAMNTLSENYENVFDVSEIMILDEDEFNFINNPDVTFGIPENLKTENKLKELTDNDANILLTYISPRCNTKYGIDVINGFYIINTGNDFATRLIKDNDIDFVLSGFPPTARAVDSGGNLIGEGIYSDNLWFNPGMLYNGTAGIFIINTKTDSAKYYIISLNPEYK